MFASNFFLHLQHQLSIPTKGLQLFMISQNEIIEDCMWWRITGSNRWPPACKAGALPAELIPHYLGEIWWVWMDSNHRPPPYQDGALTSWATDPVKVAINAAIAMLANLFWCCYCRTTDKCECLQSRFFSLERRWSSRTFRYGYLVTTSPQSWILPW